MHGGPGNKVANFMYVHVAQVYIVSVSYFQFCWIGNVVVLVI